MFSSIAIHLSNEKDEEALTKVDYRWRHSGENMELCK